MPDEAEVHKKDYSLQIHFGFILAGSFGVGLFSVMAGFSEDAIWGAFIIGAIGGVVAGFIANWIRNNAQQPKVTNSSEM
jgi:hypothetical protein